jgi:hypothetical protein
MNRATKIVGVVSICWLLAACSSSESVGENERNRWYQPSVTASWYWQLSGALDMNEKVDIYIVDLFDTNKSTVSALHAKGRKVIAYFSAGSYESWRPDALSFDVSLLGEKMNGWDERWLDISHASLHPIMVARIALAKEKGFDGIEADNVDGYVNKTGFKLTAKDQLNYNKFLALEAHKKGLSIALKNDLDQIEALEPYFDFAINEQCHQFDECEMTLPFIRANKPVFNAEYDDTKEEEVCSNAKKLGLQTLFLPLELDGSFRKVCP